MGMGTGKVREVEEATRLEERERLAPEEMAQMERQREHSRERSKRWARRSRGRGRQRKETKRLGPRSGSTCYSPG